jgi:nucleotide-binding universal stress UspA family protein
MPLATSILCPIDFSAHAERALRHAVAIAGATGAHLTVVTINDPVLVAATSAAGHAATLRAQVEAALEETLARVPQHTTRVVPAIDIVTGAPADEILKAAARAGAHLVVMGTRGLGGAKTIVFGSTAERVVRAATVPVLVVPDYSPERMSVELGATRFTVHEVVAAVGFDSTDSTVAATAGAWAHACGAALTLAHVCAAPPTPAWWPFADGSQQTERLDTALAQLDRLARDTEGAAPAKLEVRRGAVDQELATLVREREAGLLVVSRGAGRHRLGTTAFRIIADARIPTVVVPSA